MHISKNIFLNALGMPKPVQEKKEKKEKPGVSIVDFQRRQPIDAIQPIAALFLSGQPAKRARVY